MYQECIKHFYPIMVIYLVMPECQLFTFHFGPYGVQLGTVLLYVVDD